jgi:hypothetical protein
MHVFLLEKNSPILILDWQVMKKINEGYGLSFVSLGRGPFPEQVLHTYRPMQLD